MKKYMTNLDYQQLYLQGQQIKIFYINNIEKFEKKNIK